MGGWVAKIAIGGFYTPNANACCSYVVKKKKKINLVLVCEEKKRVGGTRRE